MDAQQIARFLQSLSPAERAVKFNSIITGFDAAVGLRFDHVDSQEVRLTLVVTDAHLQPYGLTHGGVYATMIESACSVGAAFSVLAKGMSTVGVDNSTSFLSGVRAGATLSLVATPVHQGRRSQLWEATITDETDRRCAVGRVRLLCLEPGTNIAGQVLSISG